MSGFYPVAISMKTDRESVTVTFKDGHRVIFEAYRNVVTTSLEGIRRFLLYRGNRIVVEYHGQLQYSSRHMRPSENDHRFYEVARGYTHQLIVGYWQAAMRFIENDYEDKILAVPIERMPKPPHPAYFSHQVAEVSLRDLNYIKDLRLPDGK
jgi:hypothetical protein